MTILCLFQIDPDTREATGTVVPFCSENCRHEAKSSLDFPDHTEGISGDSDFGFTPQCVQCGVEITPTDSAVVVGNQPSITAAETAISAHAKALGLSGDKDVQVWHLLYSLLEYCAVRGVDFDKELSEVKDGIASGTLSAPACVALAQKKLQEARLGQQHT